MCCIKLGIEKYKLGNEKKEVQNHHWSFEENNFALRLKLIEDTTTPCAILKGPLSILSPVHEIEAN